MVIEADVFPAALVSLTDQDEYVRENVITLRKGVVKQSPEVSQVIVSCGGLAVVINYLGYSYGNPWLPGIMMLGYILYIAAHSEKLAIIVSKGLPQAMCLSEEYEQQIKVASVWSISQIGHHTPEHAKVVATGTANLPKLLELYLDASSSKDLQAKSEALKSVLQKCTDLQALGPLLYKAPTNILKHLCQFICETLIYDSFSKCVPRSLLNRYWLQKVLPHDSKARRMFVTSGALKKVQEIKADLTLPCNSTFVPSKAVSLKM